MAFLDIIKINHWLNARKITLNFIKKKNSNLYKKLKKKQNFKASNKEIQFLLNNLYIEKNDLVLRKSLPEFIFHSKKKIDSSKRPIMRDGIHFYNYYTLPSPKGFKAPVILDILCPHNKIPKLNNGHLEQAITINLGPGNIYGRWGTDVKKKENFSEIKFNNENEKWVVGDTYLEPTFLPHTYSLVNKTPSQILSYTAKSQLQKFVDNSNLWPVLSYNNFIKDIELNGNNISFLKTYLNSRGIENHYIAEKTKISLKEINRFFRKKILTQNKDKNILNKICKLISINPNIFFRKKFNQDLVGKTYLSYRDSIKSIRKYKSYKVSSMSASERYPDLFGFFIKVSKKNKSKDLFYHASTHYIVTSGEMYFNVNTKSQIIKKGDAIWIAPFIRHGFSGKGSLIKISNGECLDYQDIYEINNIFNYKHVLKRAHKDKINWGYQK
tara:strand:+ start:6997 stop:8316 length:1320 start_codon:yes stop_codon:yes gene_type:complete